MLATQGRPNTLPPKSPGHTRQKICQQQAGTKPRTDDWLLAFFPASGWAPLPSLTSLIIGGKIDNVNIFCAFLEEKLFAISDH